MVRKLQLLVVIAGLCSTVPVKAAPVPLCDPCEKSCPTADGKSPCQSTPAEIAHFERMLIVAAGVGLVLLVIGIKLTRRFEIRYLKPILTAKAQRISYGRHPCSVRAYRAILNAARRSVGL